MTKILTISTLIALLTACGNHGSNQNSQSVVRVNDDEITVHQVNYLLQRSNVNEKNKDALTKQIVSGLVDRQILVQEALKSELDRNPQVMQAIEDNKMQILAKAYLENKMSTAAKPTEAEITAYRNQHPEIFENRKLYAMEEVTFVVSQPLDAELESLSNSAKSMDEVVAWLDSKQLKYARNKAVRAAESFPTALLGKINQLKSDELIFVRGPNGISVARVIETRAQPIAANDAKPIIQRLLVTQKQKTIAEAEMLRLRKESKIEYIDKKYETSAQTKAGEIKTKSEEKAEVAPAESSSKEEAGKKVDAHVEKGLSGL